MTARFRIGSTATLIQADGRYKDRAASAQKFLADVAEYWHRCNYKIPPSGVIVTVALGDRLDAAMPHESELLLAPTRRKLGQRSVMLMPDFYFISSGGYKKLRRYVVEHDKEWNQKMDVAYWRGSTTGNADSSRNERIRFWRQHRDKADLGLTSLGASSHIGLPLVETQPVFVHLRNRYQIDIAGHSCSWDGLFWKLLSNSLVLRVDQRDEQWYYAKLRPWIHYVPCTRANFERRLAWCRAHPETCQRMATAASAVMASLTYEDELSSFALKLASRLGLGRKRLFGSEKRARRMLRAMMGQ